MWIIVFIQFSPDNCSKEITPDTNKDKSEGSHSFNYTHSGPLMSST